MNTTTTETTLLEALLHDIEHRIYDTVAEHLEHSLPRDTSATIAAAAAHAGRKRARLLLARRYFCASPTCPGYPFKASDHAHPARTCPP